MTNEQVYEVIKQNLGDVPVNDMGWVAKGVHLLELIVGAKGNPQFGDPKFPNVAQFEPDRRILKLDGMEDYNALVRKLEKIRQWPTNKMYPDAVLPKVNQPMATISGKPIESYYETPKITPVEHFDSDAEKLIKGVPPTPSKVETQMQDFMMTMMTKIEDIGNRLASLEKPAPKVGRPAKVVETHDVSTPEPKK